MTPQEKVLYLKSKGLSIPYIAVVCNLSDTGMRNIAKGITTDVKVSTSSAIDQLYRQQLAKDNRAKKKELSND